MKQRLIITGYCLVIAAAVVSVSSCSSVPKTDAASLRQRLSMINTSNGIDKKEAMVIAQNYMIENGYDYDWDITSPKDDGESSGTKSWSIVFRPIEDGWGSGRRKMSEVTFEQMMNFYVKVDKATGEAFGSKTIISEAYSQ